MDLDLTRTLAVLLVYYFRRRATVSIITTMIAKPGQLLGTCELRRYQAKLDKCLVHCLLYRGLRFSRAGGLRLRSLVPGHCGELG